MIRPETITQKGGAPIELSDPAAFFSFRSGLDREQVGAMVRPENAQIYEVSFATTGRNPGNYLVRYAIDRSKGEAYVYFPGKPDPGTRKTSR